MTTGATLVAPAETGQCGTPAAARDRHQNEVMHHLARIGFSATPGGANSRAHRVRVELLEIVRAFIAVDSFDALDRFLAPLDQARLEGVVHLTDAAFTSIERNDAEDGVTRVRYHGEPTLENARAARNAAQRVIRAQLEFIRGLHTAHPELAR